MDAYEQAMIDLLEATDGKGLRVNIVPHTPGVYPFAPLKPRAFGLKLKELVATLEENSVFLPPAGERALARNVELLARAWIAAVDSNAC
jgi:hypothetical protein